MSAVSKPTAAQVRQFEQRVSALFADPKVGGDLLLVGIYMTRQLVLHRDGPYALDYISIATAIYGEARANLYTLKRELRADIRRYEAYADPANAAHRHHTSVCPAPMIRRAGECGQHATDSSHLVDLDTGRRYYLSTCARHHPWRREREAANDAEVKAAGPHLPIPPANTGGVLRPHLPEIMWEKYWRKLDPQWVEPPEEKLITRPRLQILLPGDDFEPVDMPRPALTLITEGTSHA